MTDGRHRVLVVDDAASPARPADGAARDRGRRRRPGTAADGRQAIERARALGPDIVLLDPAMPVMDGLEALPELRAVPPRAQVVVFSGFVHRALADQALVAGADDVVEAGMTVTHLGRRPRGLRDGAED